MMDNKNSLHTGEIFSHSPETGRIGAFLDFIAGAELALAHYSGVVNQPDLGPRMDGGSPGHILDDRKRQLEGKKTHPYHTSNDRLAETDLHLAASSQPPAIGTTTSNGNYIEAISSEIVPLATVTDISSAGNAAVGSMIDPGFQREVA